MSPRCQYSGFSFTKPPPVSHLSVTESTMKTAEPSIHTNNHRALFSLKVSHVHCHISHASRACPYRVTPGPSFLCYTHLKGLVLSPRKQRSHHSTESWALQSKR